MLSLLAHSPETVDTDAFSVEATDVAALSEVWTSPVTAAAAAAHAQQTTWLISM